MRVLLQKLSDLYGEYQPPNFQDLPDEESELCELAHNTAFDTWNDPKLNCVVNFAAPGYPVKATNLNVNIWITKANTWDEAITNCKTLVYNAIFAQVYDKSVKQEKAIKIAKAVGLAYLVRCLHSTPNYTYKPC